MTDKERKVVFILIGIMVLILILVVCVKAFDKGGESSQNIAGTNTIATNSIENNNEKYSTELNDGTKLNTSDDLQNRKTYKTVEISGIQVTTSSEGNSAIIADVKNSGSTTFVKEIVSLTLLGDNNQVIRTLDVILPEVEPGETKQANWMVSGDIANIKDFKIEAK